MQNPTQLDQHLGTKCAALSINWTMTKQQKVQMLRTKFPKQFRELALVGTVLRRERGLLNIDTVAHLTGMHPDEVRRVAWVYGSKGHKLLPIRYFQSKMKTVETLKWGAKT